MIVVYILVYYGLGTLNPVPPMADMASCERARAVFVKRGATSAECVQVVIPATDSKAYYNMPNKIGEAK